MNPHIRWCTRPDLAAMLEIERRSFEFAWTKDDFLRCLRQRNCIGMVAMDREIVCGFVIYELHKSRLHVLNFAVHPDYRRMGVGEAMARRLKDKLNPQRRQRITLEVRETNVAAQLFWSAMGWKCIDVLRDFYEDTAEDAYVFQFRVKRPVEVQA